VNNGVVVFSESLKDVETKDDCRLRGSDAFSQFCNKNASLSFAEGSNLVNRYEWMSPKSPLGEVSRASGSFGASKCGTVQ
jgi:hypothetical protein